MLTSDPTELLIRRQEHNDNMRQGAHVLLASKHIVRGLAHVLSKQNVISVLECRFRLQLGFDFLCYGIFM